MRRFKEMLAVFLCVCGDYFLIICHCPGFVCVSPLSFEVVPRHCWSDISQGRDSRKSESLNSVKLRGMHSSAVCDRLQNSLYKISVSSWAKRLNILIRGLYSREG